MNEALTGPDAVIDAGPALTFLARSDTTRILFTGLGVTGSGLLAPEQVDMEVRRKSGRDKTRFGACAAKWSQIAAVGRLTILSDDETPELAAAVHRLVKMPMSRRMREQKDLGELLVIAHASVRAEAGADVAVLIQEHDGTQMAHVEAQRIQRLPSPGRLRVWDTPSILRRAIGSEYLPSRGAMKAIYERLRTLDLALPPIGETNLLDAAEWERRDC